MGIEFALYFFLLPMIFSEYAYSCLLCSCSRMCHHGALGLRQRLLRANDAHLYYSAFCHDHGRSIYTMGNGKPTNHTPCAPTGKPLIKPLPAQHWIYTR